MIHILHCYGHASVSLYSENSFAGHSIVKTVQCHIIIAIALITNLHCAYFLNFCRLTVGFENRKISIFQFQLTTTQYQNTVAWNILTSYLMINLISRYWPMWIFGNNTDTPAIHGPIVDTNTSKIFKSCFLLHYQKYDILCLVFLVKTSKIRIYELEFFKLQQFQYFAIIFSLPD